ncbi:Ring-type e3 ubiquitin transferase [Thalictrum thalictroides]|uniref:U-box domain-containing protein n=1 Tax=Thalictrum thalictroides TaxID=46969 RepID=A0A7J6VT20_THATH|nr:Ring-type e3 ubiquitin transferase [Thalictrum thalictroides]
MVRNDLFITVPNFFKCPISLDVMKSPVSLCTGVTYDRSSIQAWLDNGNNTCPATMQVLPSKDFVPNHTLHRLIQIWSNSINTSSQSPQNHSISRQQVRDLIKKIEAKDSNCNEGFSKIIEFAKICDENRKFVADVEGFVPVLLDILSNVKIIDKDVMKNIVVFEQTIRVLDLVLMEYRDKDQLIRSMVARNRDLLTSILLILEKGNLDSRIGAVRVLQIIAIDTETKLQIAEKEGMLNQLFQLITSETDSTAIEAGLYCLIAISIPRRIKVKMVRFGLVQTLGKMLSQLESSSFSIIEKILKLLEMISSCTEGRTAICTDLVCVTAIVEKMLKVSKTATEHAIVIMWSVCYLFRDQMAQETVMKSNGLTKILLIMQSNYSPSVRQMCGDLMKIFRVNSKSCLCYDTKTTHIMPF